MKTELAMLRDYLLAKEGAVEDWPFGPDAWVFKVLGKMFALIAWQKVPPHITLKCDPDYALMLRDRYEAVGPGYHMNKVHWNTVVLDGSIPQDEIREMIDLSYTLVLKGIKKTVRAERGASSR